MSILRVALLQMNSFKNDQEANLQKGVQFCTLAKSMDADIALFPEMWNIGYTPFHPRELDSFDLWRAPENWKESDRHDADERLAKARIQWQTQAINGFSPFVRRYRELARELDMAIALTYLEQWRNAPRNSVCLIDRHGETQFTYAKVHLCEFSFMEAACTAGDDFQVADLDTRHGKLKIGAMICYDREFPESARILMLKGAEIIIVPNACEIEVNRRCQFLARAFENMVGIAVTNYAHPDANGHSLAFDGMAFDEGGRSRDQLLIEAGHQEGVYLANFDLDSIRRYRLRETWGNAFRHPKVYGAIVASQVSYPFLRVDWRGQRRA